MAKKPAKNTGKRKAVKIFWIVLISPFAIFALLLLLISIGVFGKLPSFDDLENPKSNLATEIYSEDGKVLGSFFRENRVFVSYEELSPNLVAALVATEDARFYSHSGIDFMGLARVAVKTVILGQKRQGGGSTISQQVAKNLYKTREDIAEGASGKNPNIIIAKLKEWITAVMLEYNYTKEEIISMYLNTVPYGSNAYGIKAASHTFFNKEPSELTIEEAAVLVGVVNKPTRYSPVRNPENSTRRRNVVISRMETQNFISREERDSLIRLPITLDFNPISHNTGSGTYFREMLRMTMNMQRPKRENYYYEWDYLQAVKLWDDNPIYGWCVKNEKSDGTRYSLYQDGLKIYTTINHTMQKYAEEASVEHMKSLQADLDRQVKNSGVLFQGISKKEIDNIMTNAIRGTDRYRAMKAEDKSDREINDNFNKPVNMRIFTYKGAVDTVMPPRDSILHHKRQLRPSFMAMDPITGHVKAYVGGPDFRFFKYDMVKQGKRQVGSTIKPFIYTFAIDFLGLTPCTPVKNVPYTIEAAGTDAWSPKEAGAGSRPYEEIYDDEYKPLKWGLIKSRNNFSAWIMKEAKSPSAVVEFLHKMGIRSYIEPYNPLSLGSMDVSLYEMVAAYSTFVNDGVHTEPIFVTRIEDRYGNEIASFTAQTSDAINDQTAFTMLGILKDVVSSQGTGARLGWMYHISGDVGGKTGTSQNQSDTWFFGIAPKLVAGAWVGAEDRSVHLRQTADGARVALPIYANFMNRVYKDESLGISMSDKFTTPTGAVIYNCNEDVYVRDNTPDEFFD